MLNEKLILELKKYFIDAYKNKISLNEDFIYKLGEILVNNLDLSDYVKDIQIINLNGKDLGQYIRSRKIVTYDLASVIHLLNSVTNLNLSYDSRILYYYVSILEFLAHEIEHANQYKKANFNDVNLENRILANSLMFKGAYSNVLFYNEVVKIFGTMKADDYFKQKFNVYTDNHDLAPEEKLANYYAINLILEILKEYPDNKDLINFKKYILLKYLMMGYDKDLSPTDTYLHKLNIDISKDLNKDDLKLFRRLSLGLKIKEEEYKDLNLMSRRLAKIVYSY